MIRIPSWLIGAVFLIAFVGFLDASYMAANYFLEVIPPCSITGGGCSTVTTSSYSEILGVPIALLGAFFYLSILILWMWYADKMDDRVLKIFPWITAAGFLFSLWLLFVQAFILKAYCSYCLLSTLTSTSLFVLALLIARYRKSLSLS